MSRHNRRVPTTFYNRFAHDARIFADGVAQGRVVGILEGGYSDRALVGGGIAWVAGMLESEEKEWWSVTNLEKVGILCVSSPIVLFDLGSGYAA